MAVKKAVAVQREAARQLATFRHGMRSHRGSSVVSVMNAGGAGDVGVPGEGTVAVSDGARLMPVWDRMVQTVPQRGQVDINTGKLSPPFLASK